MTDTLHDPEWLADFLSIPLASVYAMNSRGSGPRRIRVGKHVRYRRSDVEAWLAMNAVEPEPAK